jgi:hypothetical protein
LLRLVSTQARSQAGRGKQGMAAPLGIAHGRFIVKHIPDSIMVLDVGCCQSSGSA